METVAVVIPVRNRPKKLRRAVRSIQSQDYPVGEIIIVDDASDDSETLRVAHELASADKRINVVEHQDRRGGGAARNSGIREATAEWIAFLDSDDEWLPPKISTQLGSLANGSGAIANFACSRLVVDGVPQRLFPPQLPSIPLDLYKANILGPTSSALIRRSALERVGGFDEALTSCQDWDLWIRLSRTGEFTTSLEPLVLFHQDGGDRISRNNDAVIAGHRAILTKIEKDLSWEECRKVRAAHHRRIAEIYLADLNQPIRAMFHAGRSLTYDRTDAWIARRILVRAAKRVAGRGKVS